MTDPQAFCRDVLAGRAAPRLPARGEDRAETLRLLRAHRLLGLWIAESEPDDADAPVRAQLAAQTFHGVLTLEAADRARGALRASGFQVLLVKGAGLIRAGVYPGAGARALGDADLLLRGGDADEAVRLLEEAGFEPWVPWVPERHAWLPAFTLSDGRAPGGIDVTVDLHWRIPYGSYRSGGEADDSMLWEEADLEAGLPSPEVQAVLVAEHFVRHLRVVPHLVGLADLVRLLPRVSDPERLGELARSRGTLRTLQGLLWFLETELGMQVEHEVRAAVGGPERVGPLRSRLLRLEGLLAASSGRSRGRVSGILVQAALEGSPWDFARELLHVVHPPSDWLSRRAGPDARGGARLRFAYWAELARWALGRGASPLSPNQELEGPTGKS